MTTEGNLELTQRLWSSIDAKDFDTIAGLFNDDAEYTDAATPPDDVASGGNEVVARLRLAFEGVEISTELQNVVADDNAVMAERTETWTWKTGEELGLQIACVVEITDGKISRWVDYWDLQTLLNVAPAWWVEQVMKGWKS
ncbi:MAG: nuclear transport factor 2 family protein [Acidimicrobiales bacterium]|jgi:ketosteroid isomerase-like protein